MGEEQPQTGRFEFRILPKQRGDFLHKVREAVKPNPFIVMERMEGTDLILTVIPASLTPGTAQQLADLASQVEVRQVQAGKADAEVDF